MLRKEKGKAISIRNIIILVFTGFTVITVALISLSIFSNWRSSSEDTIRAIAEGITTEIYDQIESFIYEPLQMNEGNRQLIENGIVDLENDLERDKFFVGVLRTHSDVIYSVSYGSEKGEYYGARRNENGEIEIMRNNTVTGGQSWYYSVNENLSAGELVVQAGEFDPRTRDWYKVAKETGKPVFSPIYKHFIMPDLTVSAAFPIYNSKGELQGVLGTHIILSNINGLLKKLTDNTYGYAVIVEKESGEFVANSFDIANFLVLDDGKVQRTKITEIDNNAIIQAYNHYVSSQINNFTEVIPNGTLYFNIAEYSANGLDWIVLSAVPESLLFSDIQASMFSTIILVFILVLLSVGIYFVTAKKLFEPIENLIKATELVSFGDLSQRVAVSRNDELGRIGSSFNTMADTIHLLINNLETKVEERTTELEATNDALEESREELRLILDSAAEAIYGIDKEGLCTFCNTSCIDILGYQNEDEMLGQSMHLLIHHSFKDNKPMDIDGCKIHKSLHEGLGAHVDDEVFWRADGTSIDVEYYSYPQYKNGEIVGAVVTFTDITERKKNDEKITYLSCHDSLTGLKNRRCFEEELVKRDTEDHLPITILFADINGLKLTNDIFGHSSGDTLIRKSAEILTKSCRAGDIVSRVGGDEFILLLPRTEAHDAEQIIEKVRNEMAKEKVDAIKCSIALGYDTKTDMHQNIERVMENAENEMYKEKTLSRREFGHEMINTIIQTLHKRRLIEKNHSEAVSDLCVRIGCALDLPETEIKKLKEAGYLHDIGKIILDKNLIYRGSPQSTEEKQQMQQHTVVGYRILNLFDDTLDLAEAIYSHHEKWDGSGYPKGLKGTEIPVLARIIAIAEYYDRKLNDPTGQSITKEEAVGSIREGAGKRFDPKIAELFAHMMDAKKSE